MPIRDVFICFINVALQSMQACVLTLIFSLCQMYIGRGLSKLKDTRIVATGFSAVAHG